MESPLPGLLVSGAGWLETAALETWLEAGALEAGTLGAWLEEA